MTMSEVLRTAAQTATALAPLAPGVIACTPADIQPTPPIGNVLPTTDRPPQPDEMGPAVETGNPSDTLKLGYLPFDQGLFTESSATPQVDVVTLDLVTRTKAEAKLLDYAPQDGAQFFRIRSVSGKTDARVLITPISDIDTRTTIAPNTDTDGLNLVLITVEGTEGVLTGVSGLVANEPDTNDTVVGISVLSDKGLEKLTSGNQKTINVNGDDIVGSFMFVTLLPEVDPSEYKKAALEAETPEEKVDVAQRYIRSISTASPEGVLEQQIPSDIQIKTATNGYQAANINVLNAVGGALTMFAPFISVVQGPIQPPDAAPSPTPAKPEPTIDVIEPSRTPTTGTKPTTAPTAANTPSLTAEAVVPSATRGVTKVAQAEPTPVSPTPGPTEGPTDEPTPAATPSQSESLIGPDGKLVPKIALKFLAIGQDEKVWGRIPLNSDNTVVLGVVTKFEPIRGASRGGFSAIVEREAFHDNGHEFIGLIAQTPDGAIIHLKMRIDEFTGLNKKGFAFVGYSDASKGVWTSNPALSPVGNKTDTFTAVELLKIKSNFLVGDQIVVNIADMRNAQNSPNLTDEQLQEVSASNAEFGEINAALISGEKPLINDMTIGSVINIIDSSDR